MYVGFALLPRRRWHWLMVEKREDWALLRSVRATEPFRQAGKVPPDGLASARTRFGASIVLLGGWWVVTASGALRSSTTVAGTYSANTVPTTLTESSSIADSTP